MKTLTIKLDDEQSAQLEQLQSLFFQKTATKTILQIIADHADLMKRSDNKSKIITGLKAQLAEFE